ncbi:uncharacterized protein LOC126369545 [Pectinophora gossypiella]|uniref:uncharacterized protein LOC126369545 n=1 Tax=Pectinophora gossypiella TaxID=13191 RepID=UPI00214DFD45|nr:uncharacterized protein LOC126369545 [Pectinophora gossypiella]
MILWGLFLFLMTLQYSFGGVIDPQEDICRSLTSCSTCVVKSYCSWCITKNRCTKQSCRNDNVIYPEFSTALMSGPTFCPRVEVDPTEDKILKSGKREVITLKITQIHLHMAFTPWKCRIVVGGKEQVVSAAIVAGTVYCDAVVLNNESGDPSVAGEVSVMWDYNKRLDGAVPIKIYS